MVHQGVSIENALPHLDDVEIMVSQGHTVPQDGPVTWLSGLTVAILSNNILYSVDLRATVVCVYNNHCPSDLVLLFSVHHVVFIILVWVGV